MSKWHLNITRTNCNHLTQNNVWNLLVSAMPPGSKLVDHLLNYCAGACSLTGSIDNIKSTTLVMEAMWLSFLMSPEPLWSVADEGVVKQHTHGLHFAVVLDWHWSLRLTLWLPLRIGQWSNHFKFGYIDHINPPGTRNLHQKHNGTVCILYGKNLSHCHRLKSTGLVLICTAFCFRVFNSGLGSNNHL